eukprot:GHVS01064474.1.p1 GENE.GHVS01064474.1~~GHVS01064474.1.p1  ORF type:complete len:379 (-),score=26.24 GHVS01064474.1:76-1212(-)
MARLTNRLGILFSLLVLGFSLPIAAITRERFNVNNNVWYFHARSAKPTPLDIKHALETKLLKYPMNRCSWEIKWDETNSNVFIRLTFTESHEPKPAHQNDAYLATMPEYSLNTARTVFKKGFELIEVVADSSFKMPNINTAMSQSFLDSLPDEAFFKVPDHSTSQSQNSRPPAARKGQPDISTVHDPDRSSRDTGRSTPPAADKGQPDSSTVHKSDTDRSSRDTGRSAHSAAHKGQPDRETGRSAAPKQDTDRSSRDTGRSTPPAADKGQPDSSTVHNPDTDRSSRDTDRSAAHNRDAGRSSRDTDRSASDHTDPSAESSCPPTDPRTADGAAPYRISHPTNRDSIKSSDVVGFSRPSWLVMVALGCLTTSTSFYFGN